MGLTRFSATPGPIPFWTRLSVHAAATATEERTIFSAPFACILKKVDIVADAAVTGDNSNTTKLNIINKGAVGAGTTEVGNLDLITGVNLVAFDSKNIPLNATYLASGVTLADGDTVNIQFEKVGNGVAIPESQVYLEYYPL